MNEKIEKSLKHFKPLYFREQNKGEMFFSVSRQTASSLALTLVSDLGIDQLGAHTKRYVPPNSLC